MAQSLLRALARGVCATNMKIEGLLAEVGGRPLTTTPKPRRPRSPNLLTRPSHLDRVGHWVWFSEIPFPPGGPPVGAV